MSTPLDREHFLKGFIAEAEDHLRIVNANLLSVEKATRSGAPQARHVRELFRSLHTLKGLAAMVGVEPVVELAHHMEAILRTADRSGGKLALAAVELLLKGTAAIEQRVRAVAERKPVPAPPEQLLASLASLEPTLGPSGSAAAGAELALEPELRAKLSPAEIEQIVEGAARGKRAARIDFVPSTARASQGITITSVREAVGQLAEIVKVIPRTTPLGLAFALIVLTDAPDEKLAATAQASPESVVTILAGRSGQAMSELDEPLALDDRTLRHGIVRVDVARLDDALEKLSALVVNRFRLVRAANDLRDRGSDVRDLTQILAETARQLRDLRAAIMRARMVSVSELLERVPLIVRGLSQTTGKAVRLEVDAGRAELDKSVAERIFPAIVHLVRNAVDHALESPDERVRAGKPLEGHIKVSCFEQSDSQLELQVSDDGRGVDAEAVARKAGAPVPTSDADLLDLVTRPGLSTRDEAATSTSGRGMGLDIVKRTVVALGGELRLATGRGRGTTFTIRIPLSVSILDVFSFECARQAFVVPVAMVEEIVALEECPVYATPGATSEVRLLERRGAVVPVVELARLFELAPDANGAKKALVVRRGDDRHAFAVDRMLGQQEVVIRPLEDPLVRVPGITGTTDLGDGRPTLVLDLVALTGATALEEAVA